MHKRFSTDELPFYTLLIQQKIIYVHRQDTLLVIVGCDDIPLENPLRETFLCKHFTDTRRNYIFKSITDAIPVKKPKNCIFVSFSL